MVYRDAANGGGDRALMPKRDSLERVMQDPLSKADRYWKEAAKCYELAKSTSPTFLSGFYRQTAMQFLFMAEGELRLAERQMRRQEK
jgi:hypothetical protein